MKKFNIFTLLIIVAVFAVVFRLVNISNFSTQSSVAESTAPAHNFSKVEQPAAALEKKESTDTKPSVEAASQPAAPAAEPAAPAPAAKTDANQQPPLPPSYGGERAFSASEIDVLQSLSQRRDELDKREQQVVQREALLKAAEGEVDRKIAEMNKIKKELEDLLNKQQTVQEERLQSLVKIYEGMKPKEAARIFDTLEMDVLLAVVGKMSERKSSPILAGMDPEKARLVTIQLAEQHKLPSAVPPAATAKKDKTPTPPSLPAATEAPAPAPAPVSP